jgi:hypothetical protein
MAYVYRHIRLDKNEVFYIGIGKQANYKRAYNTYKRNDHWKKIINLTNYKVEIIEDGLSWEQACKKEKELIAFYGRDDLKKGTLVNMTDGGDGLINPSNEIRIKSGERLKKINSNPEVIKKRIDGIRNALNNNIEFAQKVSKRFKGVAKSEEHKKKIGRSGEMHHMFGKKTPIDILKKRNAAITNSYKVNGDKIKEKISKSVKAAWENPELKQKHSFKFKGEKNPMFGKTHSAEAIQKMSEKAKMRKLNKIIPVIHNFW